MVTHHHCSCRDRLDENLDRTKNVQERFHNTLEVAVGKAHLGYNEFLKLLLSQFHKKELNIKAHINDANPQPKHTKKIM